MNHKCTHLLIFCILSMQMPSFAHNITSSDISRHGRTLLYPFFSQMQLTMCLVNPVFGRKFGTVAVNLGFLVMFNLPWRLQDFNRPMFWARTLSDIVTGRITPATEARGSSRYRRYSPELTAGQLYGAIENISATLGFHPECLPKSVCELAKVPLDLEQEYLVHEIVHFILTPSEHKSFDPEERVMQAKYEYAERMGKQGANCDLLYPKCSRSFLSVISDFMESPTNLIK